MTYFSGRRLRSRIETFVTHKPDNAQTKTGRAGLDLLRFLGAVFIVVYHFGVNAPIPLEHISPVLGRGWIATDFFLIVSGFVLSRAYGQKLSERVIGRTEFFLRRFLRLWPPHFVVLLLFGALVVGSKVVGATPQHPEHFTASGFFAQALLVHGWGMFSTPSWNIPTWTLSTLLICYALFSGYAAWLMRAKPRQCLLFGLGIWGIGEIIAYRFAGTSLLDVPFRFAILRTVPFFLIGNFLERATRELRISVMQFLFALPICLTSLILISQGYGDFVSDTGLTVLLVILVAVSGNVAMPSSAITRRLGSMSLSLFLTHSLVGAIWFGAVSKAAAKLVHQTSHLSLALWIGWGAGIAVAIAISFVFELLIDRPLHAFVREASQKMSQKSKAGAFSGLKLASKAADLTP